jgi:hypothetical protein
MNVFVIGVSSETQYVNGLLSFRDLVIDANDTLAVHHGATGLYARKAGCTEFLEHKEYDALFLLDLDMTYPRDALKRLREHDLDMVSGHYYKRQLRPMFSVVDVSPDGTWPYIPLLDVPQSGLHEIASTGMGCVLIRRHVIEAVARELPPLSHPFDNGPLEWLTGSNYALGQDKRFFSIARKLGYKLYLDADVKCKHGVTAWIDDEFYLRNRDRKLQATIYNGLFLDNLGSHGVNDKTIKLRLQALELERETLLMEFESIREGKELEELQPYILKLNEYDNRMAECTDWLTGVIATVKFPNAPEDKREEFMKQRVGQPDLGDGDLETVKAVRTAVHQKEAMDFIEELDRRGR